MLGIQTWDLGMVVMDESTLLCGPPVAGYISDQGFTVWKKAGKHLSDSDRSSSKFGRFQSCISIEQHGFTDRQVGALRSSSELYHLCKFIVS